MQIDFYQLQSENQGAFDDALPKILTKILDNGKTVAVIVPSDAMARRLDERLWVSEPTDFLPHEVAGGEASSAPIVLVSKGVDNLPTADIYMSLNGALEEFPAGVVRVLEMFTSSEKQVAAARVRWKRYKEAHSLSYYAESEKGWQKKA